MQKTQLFKSSSDFLICADVAKYLFSRYAATACTEIWPKLTLVETFWSFFCLDNWLSQQNGPVCLLSCSSGSASGACCLFQSHMVKIHFKELNLFNWQRVL